MVPSTRVVSTVHPLATYSLLLLLLYFCPTTPSRVAPQRKSARAAERKREGCVRYPRAHLFRFLPRLGPAASALLRRLTLHPLDALPTQPSSCRLATEKHGRPREISRHDSGEEKQPKTHRTHDASIDTSLPVELSQRRVSRGARSEAREVTGTTTGASRICARAHPRDVFFKLFSSRHVSRELDRVLVHP